MMPDKTWLNETCKSCAWFSNGFQSEPSYCYSQDAHVDESDTCSDWQSSLRTEPVNPAPITLWDEGE